jgi:dihydroorotate dehydrogenase (NAD+) catalytic subunit
LSDLSVDIAGVHFPNPILVGSCSLTSDLGKIKRLVEAGAGGIFTKTISPDPLPGPPRHFRTGLTDGSLAVSADARMTLDEGVELIGLARESVDVPIIANVIGRSDDPDVWGGTCARLAGAGAHMIELDLNCHPEGGTEEHLVRHPDLAAYEGLSIGQDAVMTARVVRAVRAAVDVPVVSKMTLRAPDMLAVAAASAAAGADVISGVNALHGMPAVDIERAGLPLLAGFDGYALSPICGPALNILGLKWTALLSKFVAAPYISGSGVSTAEEVVERIMLGASAVAVCSVMYLKGVGVVAELVDGLREFMEAHGYEDLGAMRGLATSRLEPRAGVFGAPVVARVGDPTLWAAVAEDVYRKVELECSCIVRDDAGVGFDESRCTGCALPFVHAPSGAVEMAVV